MNVAEFKEQTKGLDEESPVFISHFTKEYILENPLYLTPCEINLSGEITETDSETMTLNRVLNLPEKTELTVDVEDGFIFNAVKEVVILGNKIVFFAK